ncbi:MAG: rod shape-determining protein MreD [Gemmatimonadaceae bacterium]|jgi:rod shape-determining protein MreD|nr:rod shape-determining protein MreD [Gemmatimonadaceae bacterium]
MTLAETGRAIVGFLVLLVAHFTLRPLLGGPVLIDFLTIAVLFSAVRVRPGVAAVIGFAVGLSIDSLSPGHFGTAAAAYTAVAFVAARLNAAFFTDNISLTGAFVLAGKWVVDAIILLLAGGLAGSGSLLQLLLWSPLSAMVTALVAVLLLMVARPWFAAPVAANRR